MTKNMRNILLGLAMAGCFVMAIYEGRRASEASYHLGKVAGVYAVMRLEIRQKTTGQPWTLEEVYALADSVAGKE